MNIKERAKKLKTDITAIFLALKDEETPSSAKIIAAITVAYALSPIDLIPDFVPILGYLDDVILLPALVALTVRLIPKEIMERNRKLAEGLWKNGKPKVAFICVHNSCRSQIAEALGKHLASDVFESYSAGTETKPRINQDAVRIMKQLHGIDMEQTQYSKLISDIPNPDIAISMGCNVGCPFIGRPFDDNWGLEDPTGQSDDKFVQTIKEIEVKIIQLRAELSD